MSKSKIKTRQSGHDPLVARAEELCAALRALDVHLTDYVGYRSHVVDMVSRFPARLRPDADRAERAAWLFAAANTAASCQYLADALTSVCGGCEYCGDPGCCEVCTERKGIAGQTAQADPFVQRLEDGE